jgi:hypothetical protein
MTLSDSENEGDQNMALYTPHADEGMTKTMMMPTGGGNPAGDDVT